MLSISSREGDCCLQASEEFASSSWLY
jgi:hypothetical protein